MGGRVSTARYLVGDVFEQLATIDDGSVDLILTSPPFLALRSYLPADHEHKHHEIGSEANPADRLATLTDPELELLVKNGTRRNAVISPISILAATF